MRRIDRLKEKWGLKSFMQVVWVLIVFACTGFTVILIKKPLFSLIKGEGETQWWMNVIYILLILPIYNILLLCYGFIFGQFDFFRKYRKKMLRRLGLKKNVEKK